MLGMGSPNDPVFFLHHAFCDKMWAMWQRSKMANGSSIEETYAPAKDGPPGHNLDDVIFPWDDKTTPRSVLDYHALGYRFDDDKDHLNFMANVSLRVFQTHF